LLLATDATDKAPRQILSFPQNILIWCPMIKTHSVYNRIKKNMC
jgi:hypothetical protein